MFIQLEDECADDVHLTRPLLRGFATVVVVSTRTFFNTLIYCLPLLFQGPLRFSAIECVALVIPLRFHVLRETGRYIWHKSLPQSTILYSFRLACMILAWIASLTLAILVLKRKGLPAASIWYYGVAVPLFSFACDAWYGISKAMALQDLPPQDDIYYSTMMSTVQGYVDGLNLFIVGSIIGTGLSSNLDAFVPNVWTYPGTGATTIFDLVEPESIQDFANAYFRQVANAVFYVLVLELAMVVGVIGMEHTIKKTRDSKTDLEGRSAKKGDPDADKSEAQNEKVETQAEMHIPWEELKARGGEKTLVSILEA